MSIDTFTISAIAIVILTVSIMFYAIYHTRSTQARLHHLEGRVGHHARRSAQVPGRAQRDLCGAVIRLHPNAQVGLDFEVADDGRGPYISRWSLDAPQPSEAELAEALEAYREEQATHSYRQARAAEYPSIGDQLDALYKARQGDMSELEAIDDLIAEVKARHPKGEACD